MKKGMKTMASLAELMVSVGADISEFSRNMKQVQSTMNNVGKSISDIGSKVNPVVTTLGGLVPVAGAVASAFSAASIGAIGYGAVATSVLGDVFDATKELEKLDEKLLSADSPDEVAKVMEERKLVMSQLSDTQKESLKSLQSFKEFWGDFTKEFEKPIGQAFSTSLGILKKGLEVFKPAISGVASAFNGFLDRVSNGFNSEPFTKFVNFVNENASKYFTQFGEITSNVFGTVINLLNGFGKSSDSVMEGLIGFTQKIEDLSSKFASLSPTIQKTIVVVGLIVAAIVPLLIIVGAVASGVSALAGMFAAVSLPVLAVIGAIALLGIGLVALWKKSETFRNIVTEVFEAIKSKVQTAIGVVVGFLKEKLAMIKQFWDENGTQILQAVNNAFNGIKKVIEFVMPVVEAIIKYVWNSIKGIIDGGLKFIMGLIKTFSSLLTGDFKGMWEGIKQMFKGAIQFVWNLMNLSFVGGLRKLAMNLVKGLVKSIKGLWDDIVLKFLYGKDKVVGYVTNLKGTAISLFNGLKDKVGSIFNKVKDLIIKPIETAKTTVLGIIDKIKGAFNKMKITIPKPKLPKVSVAMKKGVMGIPYPDFDISWNAKGGIFNGASILGGGQGVGEAGAEAVLPIQHKRYMKPFANAVASHLDSMNGKGDGEVNQHFHFAQGSFVVREEADIDRIARALLDKQKRKNRTR